jgi:hypothetical protein
MTRFGNTLAILFGASLVAACTGDIEGSTDQTDTPPAGTTSGSDTNTFDHDNNTISVWDLIDRLTKEGPPSFSSQMHGCTKPRYATLGNILKSVGINTANTTALSAGQLYTSGAAAMGQANFTARVRENIGVTTSAASREFDIFAAGAPEIIAAVPTLARCQVGGVAPVLFDASNQCHIEGLSCIMGMQATPAHVELCNLTVTRASTPDIGKRMAVAAVMAASFTCE